MSRRRDLKVMLGGQVVLGLATGMMAMAHVVKGSAGRRYCQEVVGGWAGEALLRLNDVELRVHGSIPVGPCFYMGNHSSSLDLPILMALRLPDTRTFIKERFRWYGTLGSALVLTGALFTAPQEDHERRVQRFREAETLLRRTGGSVFGSPEGTRVPGPGFGPFNRGVFHLATVLGLPIVPILIIIPPAVDPGAGVAAKTGGVVDVHLGAPIDTAGWTVDAVDANRDAVRERLVAWAKELSDAP